MDKSFFVITYSEIGGKRCTIYFPRNNFQIFSFSSSRCFIVRTKLIAGLHCTDCNSTIYRLYHIYVWSMFRKSVFKNIFRKKSKLYQRLNKVAILPKRELKKHWRFWCIYRKASLVQNFLGKVTGLESISAILLKALQRNLNIWKEQWRWYVLLHYPKLMVYGENTAHLATLLCNSSLFTSIKS